MDLKTSFAFYFISLALYLAVLTLMAFADKRVMGTRWLAYSVMVEMVKVGLQGMSGTVPRVLWTMVANELSLVAFFTLYMGLRWFVRREPLSSRTGPILLLVVMAAYCGMYSLHLPFAFPVMAAGLLWMCGITVKMLLGHVEERFRVPAGITAALVVLLMVLVVYRIDLSVQASLLGKDWQIAGTDPRWVYSLMLIVMISDCLLIMYVWFAAAEMYSAVAATAGIDSLTGCLNRRALMKVAMHEVARSERTGMPLTVVALDLDRFKRVNDTFGHPGGDAMLCAVVSLLQGRLRSVDVVARMGGEEFLLLLPDTDAVSGAVVVENLRLAMEEMQVPYEGQLITTTMSAGVTQILPRNDSWTAMLNRADRALYAAKEGGRNRVVLDELVAKLPRRQEPGTLSEAAIAAAGGGAALRLIRKRL